MCFGRSDRATTIVGAAPISRSEEASEGDRRDAGAVWLQTHPCALRREGGVVNAKRIYRLYKRWVCNCAQATQRRVKAKLREGRCVASCLNEVWAMDFVHDQLATGPKLRILTVVDTFSRFSPAWCHASASGLPTLWTCSNASAVRSVIPASIRVDQEASSLARAGPVGLRPWCRARLLQTRKADGQRLYRVVQRQVPAGRVPEPALVHEPRRRGAQMRGLA